MTLRGAEVVAKPSVCISRRRELRLGPYKGMIANFTSPVKVAGAL
jgi:hypothetical protein